MQITLQVSRSHQPSVLQNLIQNVCLAWAEFLLEGSIKSVVLVYFGLYKMSRYLVILSLEQKEYQNIDI
jgi:hypothetical protein